MEYFQLLNTHMICFHFYKYVRGSAVTFEINLDIFNIQNGMQQYLI